MVRISRIDEIDLAALGTDPLYFYVGAGLSRAVGLFGWGDLVERVHGYRVAYEGYGGDRPEADDAQANSRYLQEFVAEAGVAELPILSAGSLDARVFGRVVLLNLLFRHSERFHGMTVPTSSLILQQELWNCRPHAILTTNYDTLIERSAREDVSAYLRVYRYSAAFLPFILSNPAFVLKLHGDVNDLGSIVLDPESAWAPTGAFSGEYGFRLKKLYLSVLSRGHVIYVGAGFRDRTIRELHQAAAAASRSSSYVRLAVVPESEVHVATELGAAIAEGSFDDVTFATYSDVSPTTALLTFLRKVAHSRRGAPCAPSCREASDIRANLFSRPPFNDVQRYRTEPWTLNETNDDHSGSTTRRN